MNTKILILLFILSFFINFKLMSQVFYIDDWYKIKDDSNKPNLQLAKQYLVKSISEYEGATKKYDWQLYKILRDLIRINEDVNQYLFLVKDLSDEQFLNQILIGKSSTNIKPEDSLINNKKLVPGKFKYFERLLREGTIDTAFLYIENNFGSSSEYEKKEVIKIMFNNKFSLSQIERKIYQYGFTKRIWLELPIHNLIEKDIVTGDVALKLISDTQIGEISKIELDSYYRGVAIGLIKKGNIDSGLNVISLISDGYVRNSLLDFIGNDLYETFPENSKNIFKEQVSKGGKLSNNYVQELIYWKDKKQKFLDNNLMNFLYKYKDKLADHTLFWYYLRLDDPYFALKITDAIQSSDSGTQYEYGIAKLVELDNIDDAFKRIEQLDSSQIKDDVILKVCSALLAKGNIQKVMPFLEYPFYNTETSKDFLIIEIIYFYGSLNNMPEVEKYINSLSEIFNKLRFYHEIGRYFMGIEFRKMD